MTEVTSTATPRNGNSVLRTLLLIGAAFLIGVLVTTVAALLIRWVTDDSRSGLTLSDVVRDDIPAFANDSAPILEVAELADMPRGRAIMLSSGARAALLRTVPWYQGTKEQVEAITASIAAHDPSKRPAQPPTTPPVTVAVLEQADTAEVPVVTPAAEYDPQPVTAPIDLAGSMRRLMAQENDTDSSGKVSIGG